MVAIADSAAKVSVAAQASEVEKVSIAVGSEAARVFMVVADSAVVKAAAITVGAVMLTIVGEAFMVAVDPMAAVTAVVDRTVAATDS
jgi:hypothetical protein